MNFYDLISRQVAAHPDKVAIFSGDRTLTFAELDDLVSRYRTVLNELGVGAGDHVCLHGPNSVEWLAWFYAIPSHGAVAIPINDQLGSGAVSRIIERAEPELVVSLGTDGIVSGGGFRVLRGDELARMASDAGLTDMVSVDASLPAVMFFTSGTSGEPKGVVCSHGHEVWAIGQMIDVLKMNYQDAAVISQPFAFVMGSIMTTTVALGGGATISLLTRFRPADVVREAKRIGATFLPGVPTMHKMLADYCTETGETIDRLRVVMAGGDSVPAALRTQFRELFGVEITDLYGLTEARPLAGAPDDGVAPPDGSCGKVWPGGGVEIHRPDGSLAEPGEIGEIVAVGPAVTTCYYGNLELTAERFPDRTFRTQDLGMIDAQDNLFVFGRLDSMIKRGGLQVAPAEIEAVIADHPGVREVAVTPLPDDVFGHEIYAAVSLSAGTDVHSVMDHCREHLPKYKQPKRILVLDELPTGVTGKLARSEMAEQITEAIDGGTL